MSVHLSYLSDFCMTYYMTTYFLKLSMLHVMLCNIEEGGVAH